VILPPKKNYISQFLKQRDINSYYSILKVFISRNLKAACPAGGTYKNDRLSPLLPSSSYPMIFRYIHR
jgi:hypothetical protein